MFIGFQVFAQSKKDLEAQKLEAEKSIKFTNQLIQEAEKDKKNTYNKLLLINSKIEQRKQLITTIEKEIVYLNNQIETHQEIIITLENDLKKLKDDYARIIYESSKHRSNYHKLMFVLASKDFNTAFKRFKYLQQYSVYRKQQAIEIEKTKNNLYEEVVKLELLKSNKNNLLVNKKDEANNLLNEKNDKSKVYQTLAVQEKQLRKKLNEQHELANKLKKEIERIIAEEIRLAAERAKSSDKTTYKLTPEEKLIADIFEKNRAKLPWPTDRGVITGLFGEHPHPVIKGVIVRNDGISISTYQGAPVRAIYDGVVSRVFVINGANKTVIIRHGNYLSVYSNLKDVFVKQGDKVKTKQNIGVIFTDKNEGNSSVLQFQIWRENQKLDPQVWLAKLKN